MTDIDPLVESVINEAPVGALQRGFHTVASKLGSDKSGGRLVTADIANRLRKEYDRYIGITGYDYDRESLEAFLQHRQLSTDAVEKAITASTTGAAGNYTIGDPSVQTSSIKRNSSKQISEAPAVKSIGAAVGGVPKAPLNTRASQNQQKYGTQSQFPQMGAKPSAQPASNPTGASQAGGQGQQAAGAANQPAMTVNKPNTLTGSQIDKIILAVTQDNIRRGNINIPNEYTKGKPSDMQQASTGTITVPGVNTVALRKVDTSKLPPDQARAIQALQQQLK